MRYIISHFSHKYKARRDGGRQTGSRLTKGSPPTRPDFLLMRIHKPVIAEQMPVLEKKIPFLQKNRKVKNRRPNSCSKTQKQAEQSGRVASMPCFSRKFAENSLLSANIARRPVRPRLRPPPHSPVLSADVRRRRMCPVSGGWRAVVRSAPRENGNLAKKSANHLRESFAG